MGSPRIGLIAAPLLALSPNYFIAGKQAYPDIALCFMTSLVMYTFILSQDKPTQRILFVLGLTMGLSLITKIFSILFLPAVFVVFNFLNYGKDILKSERFWTPIFSCSLVYVLWFIPANLIGRSSEIYARGLKQKALQQEPISSVKKLPSRTLVQRYPSHRALHDSLPTLCLLED